MNAIWNLSILERPPHLTWQIRPLDARAKGVDVSQFKKVLGTALQDLGSMNDLHLNAAVLSRMIYRMKCKFRGDKGLWYMMKLNRALLNYLNMDLKKEFSILRSHLRMEDGKYVLPSRQSLEYVLARTQGFGKLMTRIEEMSKYASHFLQARIKIGHLWTVAIMALGATSRIWFHVRNTIKKCCTWYNDLYKCAQQFEYVGTRSWLPSNQNLPSNLKSWLDLDWLDTDMLYDHNSQTWQRLFVECQTEVYDDTKVTFVIPDAEIDSLMPNEEIIDLSLTEDEIASNNNVSKDKSVSSIDIDIGEIVDREEFQRSHPTKGKSITAKRKHVYTDERGNLKRNQRKRRKNK